MGFRTLCGCVGGGGKEVHCNNVKYYIGANCVLALYPIIPLGFSVCMK